MVSSKSPLEFEFTFVGTSQSSFGEVQTESLTGCLWNSGISLSIGLRPLGDLYVQCLFYGDRNTRGRLPNLLIDFQLSTCGWVTK